MKPEQYLHILAWGRQLGSFDYFIKNEQRKAAQDKAPRTAIYYSETEKRWVRYGEIVSKQTKESIKKKVEWLGRTFV
jgi:hypothetical protein